MRNKFDEPIMREHESGKRKITPRQLYETLYSSVKANLVTCIVGAIVLLVFMLLLGALVGQVGTFGMILEIVLFSIPIGVLIWGAYVSYKNMNDIKNGKYLIFIDKADRVVTDDKMVRRGRHTTMEHAMYLYRCGRQVISLEQTYTYSEGDEFYVIAFERKPDVAVLYYCTKYYELDMPKE